MYTTERFFAFVDAVLAIIMTILVLDIPQPDHASLLDLWALRTNFLAYGISFFEIFVVWRGMFTDFREVKEIGRSSISLMGLHLFVLSLLPFFTSFVADNPRVGLAEYAYTLLWALIILTGGLFYQSIRKTDHSTHPKGHPLRPGWRLGLGVGTVVASLLLIHIIPIGGLVGTLISTLFYAMPGRTK
jgi:uncharacterized membrane protein